MLVIIIYQWSKFLNLKQIKIAIYSLYLTNKFGFKFKKAKTNIEKKKLRCEYANLLLSRLNIEVIVSGLHKVDLNGQFLLLCNHRSIIDPCIVEIALQDTNIFGLWVSKKELYYSLFFGMFVRNGGAILLDRNSKKMSTFFKDIKTGLNNNASIFVFPEGTRNKQDIDLAEFKEGSRLIAVKNKLPILPMYIKTNANKILNTAINKREKGLCIEIEFGDIIDYRDRNMKLTQAYRQRFNLTSEGEV